MTNAPDRIDVVTSVRRLRHGLASEKDCIVKLTCEPGMTVSRMARRHRVAPNRLLTWRRLVADAGAMGRGIKRIFAAVAIIALTSCAAVVSPPLASDPTAEAFVQAVGSGASIVPAGQYTLDGRRMACGTAPTVLYSRLNDYAESFPKFIVVRPDLMAKPATPVKLWIYYHECGHVMRGPDTNVADCYGIERGVRERWLTDRGMNQICDFIRPGIADATHLSGERRCELMRVCYAKAKQADQLRP